MFSDTHRYVREPLPSPAKPLRSLSEWPLHVRCKMDLEVWERELRRCGLWSKHAHIMRGLREGFDQGVQNAVVPGVQ